MVKPRVRIKGKSFCEEALVRGKRVATCRYGKPKGTHRQKFCRIGRRWVRYAVYHPVREKVCRK